MTPDGADSPQVTRRLYAALAVLDGVLRDDVRSVVADLRALLDAAVADLLPAEFAAIATEPDRHGLG